MVRSDSPQQRRRRATPRKQVLTAAQAGPDVLRRFLARQRLSFSVAVATGLAAMWAGAFLAPRLPSFTWIILLAAAVVLWVVAALVRLRQRVWQTAAFFTGNCALGAAIGLVSDLSIRALVQVSVVVALPVLGLAVNVLVFKRALRPFAGALLLGPWLGIAWVVAYLLPAGELLLGVSGLAGLLSAFGLQAAGMQAARIYRPREYLAAAADVFPVLGIRLWRGWTGRS